MPPDYRWDTQPGLTMLGDASHVMPPYTGKGVNLAMLDALELADALSAAGKYGAMVGISWSAWPNAPGASPVHNRIGSAAEANWKPHPASTIANSTLR